MGLAISVGMLEQMKQYDSEGLDHFREQFALVNHFLEANGHGGWREPESLPELSLRPHVGSFPYSFLHYLRRAYAIAVTSDGDVAPTGDEGLTEHNEFVIEDESMMMSSHLLCHSDADGLYVPVDFPEPLFDLEDAGVPGGGMLGSSHALLRELRFVAPRIGITLTADGQLGDEEAARLNATDDLHPWDREYVVFLALWENARASIEHGTAIVFN